MHFKHNAELDLMLCGIVATRGKHGATITELRNDYYKAVEVPWSLRKYDTNRIIRYLNEIKSLVMVENENGTCIWYVNDGANPSERLAQDSNNNDVIIGSDVSAINPATDGSTNSSYMIKPISRAMRATSSVKDKSSIVSNNSVSMRSLDPIQVNHGKKRNPSANSSLLNGSVPDVIPSSRKRQCIDRGRPASRMPLIQENIDRHNRRNGFKSDQAVTTSTEVAASTSTANSKGYRGPNKEYLNNMFQKQCRINEGQNFENGSVASSVKSVCSLGNTDICAFGDDFMRWLISYDVFKADHTDNMDDRFSYCFRNQTIKSATTMIIDQQNFLRSQYKYMVVNLGAIDILSGRELFDILADYVRFIRAIEIIGITPIITTLPPIKLSPDHPNAKELYMTLLLFNQYIMNRFEDTHTIVDLCGPFIKAKRYSTHSYYHNISHEIVIGDNLIEVFPWNATGRQEIIDLIDQVLATI